MKFTTNFKKGDKVFMIRSWDDKGVFYIRTLTIESWGKKKGTATEDGSFIKQAIHIPTVNVSYHGRGTFMFPNTVDAEAIALELAQTFLTEQIRFLETHRIGNSAYDERHTAAEIKKLKSYTASVKKD